MSVSRTIGLFICGGLVLLPINVSGGIDFPSCWDPPTTVTNPRDTAGLYASMTLVDGFASYVDSSVVKIRNRKVGLTLTRTGYGLRSLRDLTNAMECISAAATVRDIWNLQVRRPDDAYMLLASSGYTASDPNIYFESGGQTMVVQLHWPGITVSGDAGNLAVTVSIRCDVDEPLLRLRIEVENNLVSAGLWRVYFPIIDRLGYPGQSDVCAPATSQAPSIGELRRAATGDMSYWDNTYPGSTWATQFVSVSCGPDSTVYIGCHDGYSNFKGWDYDLATRFYIYVYPGDMTVPGADYVQDWDVYLGPIGGDWFDAAQIYRQWALKQRWCQSGPLAVRDDIDKQFLETPYMVKRSYTDGPEDNRYDPTFVEHTKWLCDRAESFYGMPLIWHVYSWHKHEFDSYYPDYLPAVTGVQETFADYNDRGWLVMPYISGTLYDDRLSQWTIARNFAIRNVDGSVNYYGTTHLAKMDVSQPWYQNKIAWVVDQLYTNHSSRGVYLDIFAGGSYLCFDPDHGHPLGGGHWYADGQRDMIDVIRQTVPGVTITAEWFSEHLIDKIDGFLLWQFRYPYTCPVIPAVYADYTTLFGVGSGFINWEGMKTFAAKIGRDLIWGNMMGWFNSEWIMELPYENFATQQKRYNQIRMDTKKFLVYGRMIRPPQFHQGPPATTLENWHAYYNYDPFTIPAIDRAAWEAVDGSIGLAVLNIDSQSHTASFDVADLISGLDLHSVQLITADGTEALPWPGSVPGVLEVDVPAYDAVVVAFNAVPICDGQVYPQLDADLNQDCYVDWADFGVFASRWLDSGCNDPDWCDGSDLDHSGEVNWSDFSLFASQWLECTDPYPPCNYSP